MLSLHAAQWDAQLKTTPRLVNWYLHSRPLPFQSTWPPTCSCLIPINSSLVRNNIQPRMTQNFMLHPFLKRESSELGPLVWFDRCKGDPRPQPCKDLSSPSYSWEELMHQSEMLPSWWPVLLHIFGNDTLSEWMSALKMHKWLGQNNLHTDCNSKRNSNVILVDLKALYWWNLAESVFIFLKNYLCLC